VAKHAGLPVANIPCPNINVGLLLVSAQYISALNHKLNVSGHTLIWTFCLVLVYATFAQSSSAPFSYILYIKLLMPLVYCIYPRVIFITFIAIEAGKYWAFQPQFKILRRDQLF
jgi:hypothetical protein